MPTPFYTTLDDPSALGTTIAQGINATGQIVGNYVSSSGTQGFLYSGGTYTTLHDPSDAAHTTQAFGINGTGQIVGNYVDSSGAEQGFFYSGGTCPMPCWYFLLVPRSW